MSEIKEETQPVEPQPKLVLMKKGDYSIHILLEEIKNCIQLQEDHMPYPVVKLSCFDKSFRTEKPSDACVSYTFHEHFYFEKTNLTVEQLDSSKITIEAYDGDHCSKRSDYFGIYEFDLEYVYNQPNHALQNFWLALANPESADLTQVRGFLKISISVLHDSDPRVELKVNQNSNDCMIPSQIKMQYKMVSLHFFKAEELPDMDSTFKTKKVNRECDAFVEAHYLATKRKTSIVPMKNEVVIWNEIIDIPVNYPVVSQKIVLLVKDYDSVGSDDMIGSIELNVNDILNNKYAEMQYIPIYGAPENETGKFFDLMNNNAEIGSKWRGRILMKITYANADTPSSKTRKIEDQDLIKQAMSLSRKHLWSISAKIYSAYYLPTDKDDYSIDISWADSVASFPWKRAEKGSIEWNMVKTLAVQCSEGNIEELPDIFIHLKNNKSQAICFQRIHPKIFHLNENIMVINLYPDPCYDKVKELFRSGLVKLKIAVANKAKDKDLKCFDGFKDDNGNESSDSDWEKNVLDDNEALGLGKKVNVDMKRLHNVIVNIYMSRYIVSGDNSGQNDPYVVMQCLNQEEKTTVKYNTVNGIWNEKLCFYSLDFDINNKSTWPIFLLKVVDKDTFSSDDLLGYSYVWLSDSNYAINKIDLVKPKWQQLFLPKSNQPQGELLISFYILDNENIGWVEKINPKPETIPYSCEINILGWRDIKPLSWWPVKKAFIKFDMKSLNVGGDDKDAVQAFKTQPKDCGENPTINTVMKFDIKLPKEDIFMPELQCEVYDHLLSGMLNPWLGIFLLNIKRIIANTNKQIDEDLKIIQRKVGIFLAQGWITKQWNLGHFVGDKEEWIDDQKGDKNSDENIVNTALKNKNDNVVHPDDVALQLRPKKTIVLPIDYNAELLEEKKNDSSFFVVLPKYKTFIIPGMKKDTPNYREYQIEDELLAPSNESYFAIGTIKKTEKDEDDKGDIIEKDWTHPENITKHYRRIYRKELERVKELQIRTPFLQSYLRRGAHEDKADEMGIFAALGDIKNKVIKVYRSAEEENKIKEEKAVKREQARKKRASDSEDNIPKFLANRWYGKFKGVIRICEKKKMDQYLKAANEYKTSNPSMIQELRNWNKYETLTRNILVKNKVIIRVYVLELRDLAKKDMFSESDPYVKIYWGNKLKFDEQKNHHDDQANCKWYKHYDIWSELPGESTLRLEVWDYDPVFSDELIGITKIDLEDRFFDDKWKELKYKPIEVRSLRHPDKSAMQGSIYLWWEIFEKKERLNMAPWQIQPEPETEVEMRLIVWETEDMKCLDVEGTSDIYVTGYLEQSKKQSTDVHYRCQTGIGSFNWRMVIPISLPKDNQTLFLHVYDNDLFSRDDYICGAELNLQNILKIPKDLDVPIVFDKVYYDSVSANEKELYNNVEFMSKTDDPEQKKFWIQCYKDNKKEGRVLCSLEFLPKWKSELNKVGLGRSEPNVSPYLPPPFGRFEFSLNPFKMLNQCVGPRFRRKLYCGICLVCLVAYLCCFIPAVILHLSGEIVNPFNYRK